MSYNLWGVLKFCFIYLLLTIFDDKSLFGINVLHGKSHPKNHGQCCLKRVHHPRSAVSSGRWTKERTRPQYSETATPRSSAPPPRATRTQKRARHPTAHANPGYRCCLPALAGFTGSSLHRTRPKSPRSPIPRRTSTLFRSSVAEKGSFS